MGIGLSVRRSIIQGHSGRLWAELNNGPGATFSFTIPVYYTGEKVFQNGGLHVPVARYAESSAGIS